MEKSSISKASGSGFHETKILVRKLNLEAKWYTDGLPQQ